MKRKATSQPRRYRRSGFRQPLYRPPTVSARAARALAPEVKIQTRSLDNQDFTTSATVLQTDISRIAGGSEVYQRVGNKVKALGWHLKGVIYGSGADFFVRCVVVRLGNATDDPADAAYNLLYGTAGPTTLTAAGDNLTMTLPLNEQRMKVLYDKVVQWPTEGGESGFRAQHFTASGTLSHVVKYGSATSNDWDSGRTTVLYWAGSASGTFAVTPKLWAAASMYYTDI